MANKHNKSPRGAGIPVVKPPVAGIDIGGRQHWVCAPALAGASRELQVCGATTAELEKLAAWLQQRQVESVAMESTGVYWIPLHEILERRSSPTLLTKSSSLAPLSSNTSAQARLPSRISAFALRDFAFKKSARAESWTDRKSMSMPNKLFLRIAAGISVSSVTDGSAGQPSLPARRNSSRYISANRSKATRPKCIVPQAGSSKVISRTGLRTGRGMSPARGTR